MEKIFVRLVDMPYRVKAFVQYESITDTYTIVINSRLSYEAQCKAFRHEIKHIYNNDFEKEKVAEIEHFMSLQQKNHLLQVQ